MKGRMSTTAGFALGMVVMAVVSIAVVPVLISTAGARGFASIAVGQTIGTIGAIVITYGWNYAGPLVVARGDTHVRQTEYLESIKVRLLLTVPVTIVAVVVAAIVSPHSTGLAIWSCLSMIPIGLSASWYFVGTQEPWHLMALETIPRSACILVGMAAMLAGAGATTALQIQTGGVVLAFVLSSVWVLRGARRTTFTLRRTTTLLMLHRHGLASAILIAGYLAAPIIILRFIIPTTSLAAFAVLDRVQRQIYVAATPFAKAFQGWVPSGPEGTLPARAAKAARIAFVLGLVMTVGFGVLGHPFVNLLGGDTVDIPLAATLIMAGVIGLSFVDSVLGQAVLAPFEMMKQLARVTLVGSVAGIAALVVLAWQFGLVGGVLGMLAGLVVRVVWLCVIAARRVAAQPLSEQAAPGLT